MFSSHVTSDISAYCHGELSLDEAKKFAEHIMVCAKCRNEFDDIKLGIAFAKQLPLSQAPDSLWEQLETELSQPEGHNVKRVSYWRHPQLVAIAATVLICFVVAFLWYMRSKSTTNNQPFWQVTKLDGVPTIASKGFGNAGHLSVGQWLETDGNSRAQISVGSIGHVDVDPNTRVRLLETQPTEHRLELAEGKLSARIWAPPRLFFVDTPSAVAADLGCAYSLEVDKGGSSLLRVTSGWVELQLKDRESMVPAGAACETRPGIGPGTPYFEDASPKFRLQLAAVDFGDGPDQRSSALSRLIEESRPRDTLTLWHLLSRVDGQERVRVFDKIVSFVPLPSGVSRDGVLRLDPEMLERLRYALEGSWQDDTLVPKKLAQGYWKIKNGVSRHMSKFEVPGP